MFSLAYTISVELKEQLGRIDTLRDQILTTPIAQKTEYRLRWEAKVTRIHSSLTLAGFSVSRAQVARTLAGEHKKTADDLVILGYKQAIDMVENQWIANPKPLSFSVVSEFTSLVLPAPRDLRDRALKSVEPSIRQLLDYLAGQSEHPVIQMSIALATLSTSAAVPGDPGMVARLVAGAFLAKYGYDLRGMATPEKQWLKEGPSYQKALDHLKNEGNLNVWLLLMIQTTEDDFSEVMRTITNTRFHQDFPTSFWLLNDRQRAILHLVDDPTQAITNKIVQKRCKVSQITASRDLAKLTTLGLLFSHGKGRSVSYTRS